MVCLKIVNKKIQIGHRFQRIMNKEIIKKAISRACDILYIKNINLIKERAHERTIVNEMLPSLKEDFFEYDVWSEYNREGEIENRQSKKNIDGDIIIPDIIIHKYGPTGFNLAAIEVKGYWNNESREVDEKKLRDIHFKHGYLFLCRVELGKNEAQVIEVLPV